MAVPRESHGSPTGVPWKAHGSPMEGTWDSHGRPMGASIVISCGSFMIPWESRGHMGGPREHCKPVGDPWDFHGTTL